MKKYYFYLYCLSATLLFSCTKLLDEKQSSQFAEMTSVKACMAALDDNYRNIYNPGEAESYADDYYISDIDLNSQNFSEELRNIYKRTETAQRITGAAQWTNPYYNVYIANVVLESLEKISPGNEAKELSDYKEAKGYALFLRAFTFHQMVSIYAEAYDETTANGKLGIPLRLTSNINAVSERASIKQSYDQIIKDLEAAVSLLPERTLASTRPNKAAAYAALARVYLSMRSYEKAGVAANAALQLNSTLLDFNTIAPGSDVPFLFTNPENYYYAHSTNDIYVYTGAVVDPLLMTSYANNDLRKKIFFYDGGNGNFLYTGSFGQTIGTGTRIGLSVDEAYLIRAEAYARAGNTSAAMGDLNTLLRKRWTTGTYSDMTAVNGEDALKKILVERRKELIYRSVRWTDIKRLNKEPGFEITLQRTVQGTTYTLAPNDKRYAILLPMDVITYSNLEQNPR